MICANPKCETPKEMKPDFIIIYYCSSKLIKSSKIICYCSQKCFLACRRKKRKSKNFSNEAFETYSPIDWSKMNMSGW